MPGIAALLTRLFKSRFFPAALQVLTISFYVPMLGVLLFGAPHPDNPANLLVWLVWWPMLCVLFVLASRSWCGFFCPFGLLSSWAQRAAGLKRAVPEFLKQHSGWLMLIAYFLLFWLEEVNHVMDSPRKTAMVLLAMLSGALIFGLLFRGNAWCRTLCPLGAISHVYAHTSLFKIRANEAACAECATKDCVVPDAGFPGCPMGLTPFAIDSVANCRLCGSCLKRCPNNSVHVAFELPSRDLAGKAAASPALVTFVVLLAGFISFLNAAKSGLLPFAAWLQAAAHPVLAKTALMAGAMLAIWAAYRLTMHLAGKAAASVPLPQLELLAAVPMIPLLLATHFGYLSSRLFAEGGKLSIPLADVLHLPWLGLTSLWGAAWTGFASPLCIVLGLAATLAVSRWALARSPVPGAGRIRLACGVLYCLFAACNIFAAWPAATAAVLPAAAAAASHELSGWAVLWPFIGINAAMLALVLIARRTAQDPDAAAESLDFSASHTWIIRDEVGGRRAEISGWLVEQAVQAHWRIPAAVSLGNASHEIITFLQRTLASGSPVKVNANLRKNRAVMTISHEGLPLTLPDYKAPPSLDDADSDMLEGLELRLAGAQVEHMSYQARLSEKRCSFTLRQTC